jgi:hypothetical protein
MVKSSCAGQSRKIRKEIPGIKAILAVAGSHQFYLSSPSKVN